MNDQPAPPQKPLSGWQLLLTLGCFLLIFSILFYDQRIHDDNLRIIVFVAILILSQVLLLIVNIVTSLKNKKQVIDQEQKLARLKHHGTLIKDLPYQVISSPGQDFLIKVDYQTKIGQQLELVGAPQFTGQIRQGDLVELLIDEQDPTNYLIDFVIDLTNESCSSK